MKKTLLLVALLLTLRAGAQTTISNIVIGVDLNHDAWAKVNYNNDAFVAWLNSVGTNLSAMTDNLSKLNTNIIQFYGTNVIPGTLDTNAFSASTMTYLTGLGGGGGGSYADITDDGSGHVGINNSSPSFNMDITGNIHTTTGVQFDGIDGLGNNFLVNMTGGNGVANFTTVDGGSLQFQLTDAASGYAWSMGMNAGYFGDNRWLFYDQHTGLSPLTFQTTTDYIGVNNMTPAYQFDVNGTMGDSVSGLWNYDGAGNFTAQTFTPVSDRSRKENIKPLLPSAALSMALQMTNYSWRFRGRTNLVSSITSAYTVTNLVPIIRLLTNRFGVAVLRTNTAFQMSNLVRRTNTVSRVSPPSGTEFGPMAQDWKAVTGQGSSTNISLTSMNGLLLGAIQGLAMSQNVFTNSAGARFTLIVNPATNGFTFRPVQ